MSRVNFKILAPDQMIRSRGRSLIRKRAFCRIYAETSPSGKVICDDSSAGSLHRAKRVMFHARASAFIVSHQRIGCSLVSGNPHGSSRPWLNSTSMVLLLDFISSKLVRTSRAKENQVDLSTRALSFTPELTRAIFIRSHARVFRINLFDLKHRQGRLARLKAWRKCFASLRALQACRVVMCVIRMRPLAGNAFVTYS